MEVDGPVMVKVLKSNRIWHTSELHLHTLAVQGPVLTVVLDSKYVVFSVVELPQPMLKVQQTPNPENEGQNTILFQHMSISILRGHT